jgi:hypothetical protein
MPRDMPSLDGSQHATCALPGGLAKPRAKPGGPDRADQALLYLRDYVTFRRGSHDFLEGFEI